MEQVRTYVELLMRTEDHFTPFKEGQVIFEEGQRGNEMFLVKSGVVELRRGDSVVETVSQGGILGEMALVDQEPRSATAIAAADCELVPIDEKKFKLLVKGVPGFALEVMRIMAQRIRRATPGRAGADSGKG
jgi:CRP/FNR family cyclic AMP-dependent transcriptional regulator